MTEQENITRLRVQYSKGHDLRFTGHLDMQRLWERLLRRTRLPVRYSQGYNPRVRLNLASALPLGFVSNAELLDFWINESYPCDEIQACLSAAALPGLTIQSVHSVDLREDALQVQMMASEYKITFFDPQNKENLQEGVKNLLSKEEIIRTRRKKTYNLRPLILQLAVNTTQNGHIGLWMRLLAKPGATGRPDDVLGTLGFDNTQYLVVRTKIILSSD